MAAAARLERGPSPAIGGILPLTSTPAFFGSVGLPPVKGAASDHAPKVVQPVTAREMHRTVAVLWLYSFIADAATSAMALHALIQVGGASPSPPRSCCRAAAG